MAHPMNFEIDGSADVRTQGNHRRIEPFSVPDLKDSAALHGSGHHSVCFVDRTGDRFFDQDVNSGFQQAASNLCMRFCWYGQADGVNSSNQCAPVDVRGDIVLSSYFIDPAFVNIADCDELRPAFPRERRVDARVLLAEMAHADDCCSKCHVNSRLEAGVARRNPSRPSGQMENQVEFDHTHFLFPLVK